MQKVETDIKNWVMQQLPGPHLVDTHNVPRYFFSVSGRGPLFSFVARRALGNRFCRFVSRNPWDKRNSQQILGNPYIMLNNFFALLIIRIEIWLISCAQLVTNSEWQQSRQRLLLLLLLPLRHATMKTNNFPSWPRPCSIQKLRVCHVTSYYTHNRLRHPPSRVLPRTVCPPTNGRTGGCLSLASSQSGNSDLIYQIK